MNTERESRKLNNLCHDINFMYNKHSVIDGNAVINGIVPDEDDEYFHFSTSTETNLSKKKFRSVDYAIKYAQRHGFFKSEKR
jgi:hypothetical protein